MNHHLPPMPHGQPPIPPPRRHHEVPYSSSPRNMRPNPGYMGYPHPPAHGSGPMPMHPAQQYQQHWYPYQHMPPPPPPQPFQPYAPLIVSSYPRPHAPPPTAGPPPPPSIHTQPSTTSSTPLQSSFSSTPPPSSGPTSTTTEAHETTPVNFPPNFEVNHEPPATPARASPAPPAPIQEQAKEMPLPRQPFQPPLPWLSVPEAPFPARAPRRRRKPRMLEVSAASVELPSKPEHHEAEVQEIAEPKEPRTPTTSQPPSDIACTQPTTPSSAVPAQGSRGNQATPTQHTPSRSLLPVVPVVPIVPPSPGSSKPTQSAKGAPETSKRDVGTPNTSDATQATDAVLADDEPKPIPATRPAPKSWADLVRTKASASPLEPTPVQAGIGGPGVSKSESLVDVLSSLAVDADHTGDKLAFVEPRGLVNTGNMCYMNSVLQVLIFCVPFYDFLDRIGRRAVHSFKSELPLIDAMIMFMREFRVIDAATSVEQLRLRLKQNELEQYGDSFIPEYVYQVIRQLPRFRDMRRGHQQDAQEFLGFLLEELHEECVHAIKRASSDVSTPTDADAVSAAEDPSADGWLEVGHKQKAAVTRSSGHVAAESPITGIFGGKIRSEFRVPGNKISVTLEPYQSLQLDIGSPQVNNIIDALRGLTKPETMQGDFNSARGSKVNATKQVFIDSLPPVLVLHLKRFHYDNVSKGTQKIWKKIGYPLELELPKEVLPPHRRNVLSAQGGGLPKYRLIGVIYHHGKNASGGHYTVDVRRQDGREWVRLDDTFIRRVRSEDVANAGSEEDPKILAAALERHKQVDKPSQGNMFEQFDQDDQDSQDNERGWSQVNGTGSSGHTSKKSMAGVVNGTASPAPASGETSGKRTPSGRFGVKDNKVAYLLFYQKI